MNRRHDQVVCTGAAKSSARHWRDIFRTPTVSPLSAYASVPLPAQTVPHPLAFFRDGAANVTSHRWWKSASQSRTRAVGYLLRRIK